MNETSLREILAHLDAILAVYEEQGSKLNPLESSLRSLTKTLRAQVHSQLTMLSIDWSWKPVSPPSGKAEG